MRRAVLARWRRGSARSRRASRERRQRPRSRTCAPIWTAWICARALEQESAREATGNDAAVAALQAALDAISERIGALEAQAAEAAAAPQPTPAPAAPETPQAIAEDIAALRSALSGLATRIGALEQAAPAGDLIASLDGRVGALEAADPGRASRQAALALIVARLGAAAASGRPFEAELAALKAAAPAADIAAFSPYAARGLPSVAALGERLKALDGAVRDGADSGRGGRWRDRAWRGVGRLVTVHRDGLADGTAPEDHLARAQYHAARGDLDYAHAEMDRLSGAARGAAASWLAEAGARLALDAAVARLTETILADLARPAP